jgi:hypothetical protein
VKGQVHEADHLLPTIAEVKKMWIYASILSHMPSWHSASLVKHRDNNFTVFTSTLTLREEK